MCLCTCSLMPIPPFNSLGTRLVSMFLLPYQHISLFLSSYVRVEILSGPLSEEAIKKFQVVVLTQSSLEEQRRIGECCHGNGMCFIVASTRGLFG